MRNLIKIWFLSAWCSMSLGEQAYHYNDFNGPVSGSAEQITVPRSAGHRNPYIAYDPNEFTFDYVAKPDYKFAFGVNDPFTRNSQKHEEIREGDVVRGEYSLVEPDGSIRRVVYTADPENGFQATVLRTPAPSTIAPPALPLPDPLAELAKLPGPSAADNPSTPATNPESYPSPDSPSYPSAPDASYPTAEDSSSYPTGMDSDYYQTAPDSSIQTDKGQRSNSPSYAVYEGPEYDQ